MEDQNESILKDMEETRTSLTEKLEALETQVSEKVQPITDAVERVSEAAADIVSNVKDTVHEVTEKVEETVQSVASAFNLRRHTERHPWVVFSLSATAGCILGSFLGGSSRRRAQEQEDSSHARHKHGKGGGNGSSRQSEPEKRTRGEGKQESWFEEPLRHLKGLAISTLMGAIRDLSTRAASGALGKRIAEEVDSLTTRLGAEPIHGPVLADEPEREPEVRKETEARTEAPTATTKAPPAATLKRMRSRNGGSELF